MKRKIRKSYRTESGEPGMGGGCSHHSEQGVRDDTACAQHPRPPRQSACREDSHVGATNRMLDRTEVSYLQETVGVQSSAARNRSVGRESN